MIISGSVAVVEASNHPAFFRLTSGFCQEVNAFAQDKIVGHVIWFCEIRAEENQANRGSARYATNSPSARRLKRSILTGPKLMDSDAKTTDFKFEGRIASIEITERQVPDQVIVITAKHASGATQAHSSTA